MADIRVVLKDIHGNSIIKQSGSSGAVTLDQLDDVSLTTPTLNQVLKYNGNEWVNNDVDEEPIENSNNPITSNAVYEGVVNIESVIDYIIKSENIITLPRIVNNGKLECFSEPYEYKLPSNITTIKDYAFAYAFNTSALDGSATLPSTISKFDANNVITIDGDFIFNAAFYNSDIITLNMNKVETISGCRTMNQLCYNCLKLTTVDFENLKTISGEGNFNQAFEDCNNLIELNMPNLTTITLQDDEPDSSGYTFARCCYNCTSLKSVDFSNLTTINGSGIFSYAFYNCSNLQTVEFPMLTTINGSSGNFNWAFYNCNSLQSISFPSLSHIDNNYNNYYSNQHFGYAFYNCTSLTDVYFPSIDENSFTSTNTGEGYCPFYNMLSGCSNVTVHFPANNTTLEQILEGWANVLSGYGGSNCSTVYDL